MAGKILFVDDEPSIRSITKFFMKSRGYDCLIAASGQEAIDFLGQDEKVKIMFLDLMMPGINGFDVLEYIKNKDIKIPIIVQTGVLDKKDIDKALSLGAINYIIKPYDKAALFTLIEKYSSCGSVKS